MDDSMLYTLGQAAQATGKTKTAIAEAIKKGRISATRDESGKYQIDPAELHRVYPPASRQDRKEDPKTEQYKTHDLTAKIMLLEAQLKAVSELKDQIATERDDLRSDRDHWRTQAQGRLAAPDAPARRKWF